MAQVDGGISINAVLAFSSKVNKTIDTANDDVIINGRYLFPPSAERPRIMGKIGKTHGERIVRIPTMKEIMKSIIE